MICVHIDNAKEKRMRESGVCVCYYIHSLLTE